MPIQNFPTEVIYNIFQSLPRHTVFTCMHVCKSWQIPAMESYYQELHIRPTKIPQVVSASRGCRQTSKFLNLIQHLHFENDFDCADSDDDEEVDDEVEERVQVILREEDFLSLLSKLPRLKTLDFLSSYQGAYYMDVLNYADISQLLPPIEAIFLADHLPIFEVYFKFRKSLKRLDMMYDNLVNENETIRGAPLLSSFECLTELIIRDDSTESDSSCVDFINRCPSLIKFHFSRKSDVSDSVFNDKTNFKPKNLKEFQLEIPTLTKATINYLRRCLLPGPLEKLRVMLTEENVFEWIKKEDENLLLDFARELYCVQDILVDSDFVGNPSPHSKSDMNKLYNVFNALNSKRSLEYYGSFTDEDSSRCHIGTLNKKKIAEISMIHGCLEDGQLDWLVPGTGVSEFEFNSLNHVTFYSAQQTKTYGPDLLSFMMTHCPDIKSGRIKCDKPDNDLKFVSNGSTFDLELSGAFPEQELCQLIFNQIPRIGSLKIQAPERNTLNHDHLFNLDLTSLTELKRVSIIIQFEHEQPRGIYCAQFVNPGSDRVRCYTLNNNPPGEPVQSFEKILLNVADTHYPLSSHRVFIQCPNIERIEYSVKSEKIRWHKTNWSTRFKLSFHISK